MANLSLIYWLKDLSKKGNLLAPDEETTFFRTQAAAGTGSGRVFSRFGIWPKYGAGMGKTINILTGSGIWLFPGKRDSPKIGHGMRDLCLRVCRECRKPLKTRVNSKYQSKGSTYILHLLAFVEIRKRMRKKSGIRETEYVADAGFSRKRGGYAGSGPPLPDPAGRFGRSDKGYKRWLQAVSRP